MKKCKVVSVKKLGKRKTYSVTMASDQHNYAVYGPKGVGDQSSFLISANSHSCCYAFLSYISAYLKANYIDEVMCSILNVENHRKSHEKVVMMEKDLKNFGIVLLPKRINSCSVDYTIVKKKDVSSRIEHTEITPSIMCKGIGVASATEIAKHRPYKDFADLATKTDSKLVDQDTISSLIDAGFFDAYMKEHKRKFKKPLTKELMLQRFSDIRDDLKKAVKRGVVSQDLLE